MSEIELHRKLLGDAPRNAAFHEALRRVIVPGKTTVLDIGAGTGFLSFLAQRLGAKQCTLVEYSDALELAQQLARRNRIDGLSFVRGHSMEIQRALKADVVVTETLGNFALEEGFLETAVDARRFLKPKGLIIPGRLRQFVAPVFSHRLQRDLDIWPAIGFDLDFAPARTISLSNMYVKAITPADLGPETLTQCWDDLDLRLEAPAPDSRRTKTLQWKGADLPGARIEGYALWWEADLVEGVTISTSPWAPATHWEQIYLPLLQPVDLEAAHRLELSLVCDTRPEVGVRLGWKTRVLAGGKAVSEQVQDSFRGRL